MVQYLEVIRNFMHHFREIEVSQIPTKDNSHVNALVRLASATDVLIFKFVPLELLDASSITKMTVTDLPLEEGVN